MRTKHAIARAQQRGVPPMIVDLLLQFGQLTHDHHGAELLHFDRRSRKRVERYSGGVIGKLSEHMDAYAVMVDGRVVTVGSRYKNIPSA